MSVVSTASSDHRNLDYSCVVMTVVGSEDEEHNATEEFLAALNSGFPGWGEVPNKIAGMVVFDVKLLEGM